MTDEITQDPIPYLHNPETGQVYDNEGVEYPFKFFPQRNSKSERGKFIDSTGREITFRPMSRNAILMFHQRFEKAHKPAIPQKAYEIGEETVNGKVKKEYTYEYDPNDAVYLEQMDSYNTKLGLVLAALQVFMGLDFAMPPVGAWDEDLQALYELAVDPDSRYIKQETKYFYLMATLDDDEGNFLLRLLQGMDMPTMEGIAIAETRFPSDGE